MNTAERDNVDRVLDLLEEIEHALAEIRQLADKLKDKASDD